MDALSTGRRIKCLTCVDDFTKECLTVTVAFGISGVQVTRILDSIALFRGYPATIRTDQGPEFTCRALDQWAFEHGVELRLIQPGKPTQNGFIESFNGGLCDCLQPLLPRSRPGQSGEHRWPLSAPVYRCQEWLQGCR